MTTCLSSVQLSKSLLWQKSTLSTLNCKFSGEETTSLRFHQIYFIFTFGKIFIASNPSKSNAFSQNIFNGYTKRQLNPVYQVTTFAGDISLRVTFSQVLVNSSPAHQLRPQPPGVPNTDGCSVWERAAQILVIYNEDQVPDCQTAFKHGIYNPVS